ncbi:ZmpA/ZmpB/ZmpC family metallo-endopeptidase [Streptococcus pneumoniae]|uniref:ZmpA/ZmpB/ZmpC family metallo-endopeptidase n=1 Tax=Streptococcus pneumoniae TaxID=1313 RepID=UPI000254B62E|nr:ZmpA/ZmpB/ZmpC family metallo-endopeptidase [Streptococcus pneumoniae]EHZ19205.1 LPXTG-motif cell wall anchor domain protein [Streptococcus pneumoniae GA13224]MDS2460879.1 ZmpA/ZmpB/ZmpC family metallo-endopeptidase [Streptococcus pneumoniae]MDS2838848.1 ZmpA/ZmpB/ZmpC family metallo-endopeptidase [Streptococcus pneumoniae]MDS2894735.1 ZmpA/ZmpB/ZmpC family metallo-endopeptidase [Streptococcus pneumoniae]MDS2915435.1 ZmpA/ZmpB/ZmpC family metallo-endopeptidase [Streptococcus pneumoniae]
MFKKDRFSIRKIKGVVGSVFLGSLLMAPSVVDAATYHYVNKEIISQEAKDLIQTGKPDRNEVVYGLVYQKDQLPQTGTEASVLTAFGLLTVGSLLLIYKRKKIASVFLVGAMGLVVLPSAGAVDPVATLALASREGVVEMDGYRYVGYLSGDILKTLGLDTVLEETSAKPGEVTVVEVETPQSTTNQEQARTENQVVETEETPKEEAPKTEESPKEEPKSEVKPTDDTLPKVEEGKEDSAEPAPVEEVGGEVESKPEEKVAVKPESQPSDKPAEESKVEPPVEQAKVPEQPVQPTQAEQPSTPKESSQQENPKEDRGAEETPKQEDEQPAEAPEIKVEEPVESKEETKTAKGTQEKGHVGEALAQEQLPEYKVTEGTLVETSTTDLDYKTETTEDPTKYTDEETVLRTGEKGSQVTKTTYKTVEGVKTDQVLSTSTEVTKEPVNQQVIRGTKPIEGTLIEESLEKIPFKEVVKEDDQLKKGLEVVAQEGKEGQKKITKTFNTIKGVKTEDAPKVTEEILEEPQDKILKRGTKSFEKPVLTITEIESKDLKRTSDVKYSLENPSKAAIKSITLTLKKGDEIVKTLNVSPEDLTTTLTDLQYYKDYKLETKMVYDRGEGDEEEVLKEEPLRIDLKKVEIKDIIRTDLIKYENQVETDETRLTSVPTDLSNYYLKVTSNDHKTNLLAVQKIEESTIDGKQVYKVIAVADNLVQRNVDNRFEETYTYYIEKPKASQAGIFYDFEELIQAIQTNPAGEFKLGQSMSARNVVPKGKSYITSEFTGKLLSDGDKRYAIHNLEHPLFDKIKAGTVKNINFENIDIDLSNQDNIAAIANEISGTTRIENIKAIGTITARNNVAGFVNNIKEDATLENVAFIGSINSAGNNSTVGGIAGSNYMGFVNRAYVDATITANNANASMLVPFVQYKAHSWLSGTKGKLTNSVAKGILDVKNTKYVGGITSKTWPYGAVQDNVTYAKVIKGQEIFGSNDVNDGDANPFVSNLFGVIGYSSSEDGTGKDNKNKNKLKHLSKSEADAKVASFNITAAKFVSEPYELNKLNNVSSREAAYESIQDYNADYKLAYKNIEKLQPFYNKDFIVNQANKLDKNNKLNTKEILSVTPMNNNNFVTDLGDANKIIVHYADGTKDYFNLSSSDEGLSNVREYTITDLGIKYTPNIVQKDHSALINGIVNILSPIELQSNPIYQKLGRTGSNRVNAIKDLYLEESFDHVKANLNILVTKLVENEDHQLNNSSAAQQMILDKVEKNKAALLLGLTYLNRYYGVKFGDVNIKELMLFKPDFYGKNVSVLDRLIEIGSREDNIKGHRTYDAFSEIISKTTLSENLVNFLNYNRRLFTADVNIYDWFKKATEGNVYIAERASEVDEIKAAKYKVWDNLQSATHRKMILPLLNLNKSHVYLISNYSAMAVGTAEKLGHSSFDGIKNQIEKAADSYRNYFDFWYRLSLDKVKNMLVKNTVTPLWEGYQAPGGWPDKYGKRNNKEDYAPLRELFGPIGKYYGNNGTGAYAVIWDNPLDTRTEVNYIALSMIDEFGISVYTHETTHVNDRAIYLGGYGRRSGTHAEAYAQGMLQTPVPSTWFDEYGALGINMTFYRPNDGNQWYITDPKTLKTREDIDNYMKGYIDTLSLLDYVEGDAVISKHDDKLNQLWFKKVDPIERTVGSKDQYDKVRNMSSDDWKGITLNSVNDLVDNNLMTNRMMNNNIYKPEVFDPGIAYVGIKMMNSIYAGNTSEGAPGAVTFKNNAFRLWGYYGYDKGFLGYASDKLKSQANKEGKQFGDQYIIQKISDGRFQSFADFKKEYYKELLEKANAGFTPFTIDGETIHNYDELKSLFAKALEEDMVTNKVNGKLVQVKEKVYKKLLQQTNSFKTSIFK